MSYKETALWKEFEEKAGKDHALIAAVETVCDYGILLEKDIIRFFPTFTLHDETHICNVIQKMEMLSGDNISGLTVQECALLLMSACCHDIGMSVSEKQKKELKENGDTLHWPEYFEKNIADDNRYHDSGVITDVMLRNYVRMFHHERVDEQLDCLQNGWPGTLESYAIGQNTLSRLCRSHGEPLENLTLTDYDQDAGEYDLYLCAILLRLADILDFDASRAPQTLYDHLGLNSSQDEQETGGVTSEERAVSQTEWDKNISNKRITINRGICSFLASCKSMQTEHEIRSYINWVCEELDGCGRYLHRNPQTGSRLSLPEKVSVTITPKGYTSGEFCLTMDQDKVMELLVGQDLYSDPGVFVRELLQNSIDAVRTRAELDPTFSKENGKIDISTWDDDEEYSWFSIQDNGIGMDEEIIKNYLLKIGRSYYSSEEFERDKRRSEKANPAYKPISRFGIGILSCFMSDPENNLLEVSTRRFSTDSAGRNPAIRMKVQGLHGYYYLAREDDRNSNHAVTGKNTTDNPFRSDVGTTMTVRVNLYQVGGIHSFEELLDKYICFPEVPICLHRQNHTEKHYPTCQELMDKVHALNPDGKGQPLKEYVWEMPDEEFEKVKAEFPSVTWQKRPGVAVVYYPLDWFSGDERMTGVGVFFHGKGEGILADFHLYENEYDIHLHIFSKNFGKDYKCSAISFSNLLKDLPELARFIESSVPLRRQKANIVAYNGILADDRGLLCDSTQCLSLIVLLKDNFRPSVKIDRDTISELPPATMVSAAILNLALPVSPSEHPALSASSIAFLEAKEYETLLKPEQISRLEVVKDQTIQNIEQALLSTEEGFMKKSCSLYGNAIYNRLVKAALQMKFSICGDENGNFYISRKETQFKNRIEKFPPLLFVHPKDDFLEKFGYYRYYNSYYNSQHPFSKWLIDNQLELQQRVPGFYHQILETMILGNSRGKVVDTLNSILDSLRRYRNNYFAIPNDLRLNNDDITY